MTIGYAIIGESIHGYDYPYINSIMEDVAIMNGLTYDQDVKLLSVGDINNFYDYTERNDNKTHYAVIWCTSEW